jgi:oligoendopeptidase F
MLNLVEVITMSSKEYWVKKYIKAKKDKDEAARKRAYDQLIKILGDSLKDSDIK